MVNVELVFITADQITIQKHLILVSGATVGDALAASGISNHYPDAISWPVGIFSKRVTHQTLLSSGDRLELYRPLIIDPKEKRRQRSLK